MPIFGCASDEQFRDELDEEIAQQFKLESNQNIKKADLIKLKDHYALCMESFIKEKGLFDEFYNTKILPDLKLDINSEILTCQEVTTKR